MNPNIVDRSTFLQSLRLSKLVTGQQFGLIVDKFSHAQNARDIAKALVAAKLLTKFQARMLLAGRNAGFFLGPYCMLDMLGQGSMGRVYKAMHQTMNRVVALKILASQMVDTERAQQLFLHEVRAASQLFHPNIVMAYDAGEIDGRHFLAMEFVEGANLERYVRKNGSLPVGMACEIIFQAANGLQHAYERSMVHRDIKPANLLFQQEPGADTVQVKILDFGLARLHQPAKTRHGGKTIIAKDNTVMGTPDFLSPEQSKNLHEVDIRADLYSLGCTFYFLLTGQVPFPGGSIMDKLLRHNNEAPPSLAELRPDVPQAVEKIVRKLLAKRPADRFQTPANLSDALSPHAVPSVMDWPLTPARDRPERASDEHAVIVAGQHDTEPKAQISTQISDAESILEWVDTNRRQHRRMRRLMTAAALSFAGLLAAGLVGLLGWVLARSQ